MRHAARLRLANVLAWCAIVVVAVLFAYEAQEPSSEKLRARASVSAQQAIMTSMVNGMYAPMWSAQFATQLSVMKDQVEPLADPEEPGSELATAAILCRLGERDRALEMLAGLRNRIADGTVESDEEFDTTLAAVTSLVDGAATPGARSETDDVRSDVIDALGPTGRMLVAQSTGDTAELDRLSAAGAVALGALVAVVLGGGLVGLCGLAALVVFVVMACLGKTVGIGRARPDWAHLYAEIFAVWLLGYMLFTRVPRMLAQWWVDAGHERPSMDVLLLASVVATVVAAVVALWWGTRRGLPLRAILEDMGLRAFRFTDILWGVVCWAMALPLLALGLLLAALLSTIFGNGKIQASHPVQQMVESSGTLGLFLTYVLACVSAPFFEELFFRGALYRNLRQTFGRWGVLGSVVIAVLVNSVIFAAIHPQGLIFIPVLGSLAVAFTLMRDWRGTVNASIVAHAINNFVVLTLNVLMLRH
jgi:membrane protease YdiL (CAAX protease family)